MSEPSIKLYAFRPAPVFSSSVDGPSLATIYMSHYSRLQSVVAAARSGDNRLIRLALAELDQYGSNDESKVET